jgi:tetratricopeptide (TPR) repeat protein
VKNVTQLEQRLKKLMLENSFTEAKRLSGSILEHYPDNKLAHHTLIQYFYRFNMFNDCLKQCLKLLFFVPEDELAIRFQVLLLIESKEYLSAKSRVNFYLSKLGVNEEILLLKAEIFVCLQDFEDALITYRELYNFSPEYFSLKTRNIRRSSKQHFDNVSNLLKRNAYMRVQPCGATSKRLDSAIKCFFGLKKFVRNHEFQKGSFFNVPELSAKPFYNLDEIIGLRSFVDVIRSNMASLKLIIKETDKENYIDTIDSKSMEREWLLLSKKWQSIHLLKSKRKCKATSEIEQFQKIFENHLVADCPPHAPEAFISLLPSDTVIPPHYGLSNVKLTVHIPIFVDKLSSITVGGKTVTWGAEAAIVFDDSFLHSANNQSSNSRAVLIFDIWHPELTIEEKQGIRDFMSIYDSWSQEYGQLSKAIELL